MLDRQLEGGGDPLGGGLEALTGLLAVAPGHRLGPEHGADGSRHHQEHGPEDPGVAEEGVRTGNLSRFDGRGLASARVS